MGKVHAALAFMALGGFLAAAGVLVVGVVTGAAGITDPVTAGLVGTVRGNLSSKAEQVIAYHFGSSAGSKAKTDALTDVLKGKAP